MENKELLKKKISLGLSLSMSLDEYEKLFKKYGDYIKSIYFSPPLGEKYQSRKKIFEQFNNPENVKKFYKILELARKYNIKLDFVLNTPSLKDEYVVNAFDTIKKIDADQITCLDRHVDIISDMFPDKELIYSFNNELKMGKLDNISKKFDTVVAGKYFLRKPKCLEEINNHDFGVKILVNNGCSYNCGGCINGTKNCMRTFEHNLKNMDINEIYALQSFYPDELNKLLNHLSFTPESIKISNRTDGYDYLDKCLESYIYQVPPEEYISENSKNYRLYARTSFFNGYHDELDSKKILEYKKKGFDV